MNYLILTILPYYVAILPLLHCPIAYSYCYTIFLSTTFSILYHTYQESNWIISLFDYVMGLMWFIYDVSWGLSMTRYSFILILLLNAIVCIANQGIVHNHRYPARHSIGHLFSACKCICISMLIYESQFKGVSHHLSNDNMAFVQAMNAPSLTKTGVNGADVYTEAGVGDDCVTLGTMLVRGLEADYIQNHVQRIYQRNNREAICDLWVIAFQTRDVRGGKGERQIFYQLIRALYDVDSCTTIKMLTLIPEYGCWKDLWSIWELIPTLETSILEIVHGAYLMNSNYFGLGEFKKMNLLVKWLPREKSKTYPGLARKIANHIYRHEPSERKRMMYYRTRCSEMNRALKTVEIDMCGKTWKNINPEAVPGRCMKIHDAAFLNEKGKEELRYPNDEDRMICRANFQEFLEGLKAGTKKAHGANVVMPHELTAKAESGQTSNDQHVIIQAQWDSIREESKKAGGLGRCVPMCDFSGSMTGLPLEISKALGIHISEINHPAFQNHILTFDAVPRWHSFVGMNLLKDKLASLRGCGQGLHTNFYQACRCIIDRMVQYKVPVGEEPEDIIVITDMGFDAASNSHTQSSSSTHSAWETQMIRIRREFQEAGTQVWGKGWKPPRIVIWNIAAQFKDFHATADQEGVVQLSGWSPNILKALQKDGVQVLTPYQCMRSILDNDRYDLVRACLRT